MFNRELFNFVVIKNNEYFAEYLELIKHKIEEHSRKYKEEEERIADEITSRGGDLEYDYDPEMLTDFEVDQYEVQQMMYKSFVVSIFISMEYFTAEICEALRSEKGQLFSFKDMAGTGIGRSIKYLEKILGEHPIRDSSIREQFEIAWKVRNAVVHADGTIKKEDSPRLEKFIKKNSGLLRIEYGQVVSFAYPYAESLVKLHPQFVKALQSHLH